MQTQQTTRTRPINPERHAARVNLLTAARPAWLTVTNRQTGEIAYAVPSQTQPGKFHLTDGQTCDCKGFSYRRTCAHVAAAAALQGVA